MLFRCYLNFLAPGLLVSTGVVMYHVEWGNKWIASLMPNCSVSERELACFGGHDGRLLLLLLMLTALMKDMLTDGRMDGSFSGR